MSIFSDDERARYARHILLKEIGGPGQQKLKRARIAIVGCGGLGAPAALYLAAAGVGALRIIDPDVVSLSNLQRQVLFTTDQLGMPKPLAARAALEALNPHCAVSTVLAPLESATADAALADIDLIVEGVDRFAARHQINQLAHARGLPLVSGAVGRFDGQVSTFKSGVTRGRPLAHRSPCYACFAPMDLADDQGCAETGVVGALTGVIGTMMALEAIKEIVGIGNGLAGRMWLFDGLTAQARTVRLPADPSCTVCGGDQQSG